LKQSPRTWFERFSRTMQRFGYKSQADQTLLSGNLQKER